jgi:hypothetical protein
MTNNVAADMETNQKPYHEMTFAEYETTSHSQTVPRWSVLAVPPEQYSLSVLCRFSSDHVRCLAFLWGVNQSGSKEVLAKRIIRRHEFRVMLSQESEESLSRKPRAILVIIAQEAGVYHSWLNRKELARQLKEWHRAARQRARTEIARTRHELVVTKAARRGSSVPPENLERYHLDEHGHRERSICGTPASRALQTAPAAVTAARDLSKQNFLNWVKANPSDVLRVSLIQPGILADGGAWFWKAVQDALAPAEVPPLFAGISIDSEI